MFGRFDEGGVELGELIAGERCDVVGDVRHLKGGFSGFRHGDSFQRVRMVCPVRWWGVTSEPLGGC